MGQVGTGGGAGFAVDTAAVQAAAAGLERCAQAVLAGGRCSQVLGLGEAQDVARAMGDFTGMWDKAVGEWRRNLTAYAAVVSRAGVTMAQSEQERSGSWNGLDGAQR